MFLKNTWYVACRADEIEGKPLGRKICNESIAFYRQADGTPAAVEDFCPHRGAPLSLGFVSDGKLVCGYHGLEMGCDGKAIAMPGQRVKDFPCIKSYPVVSRYGFIWVWPGEREQADPALIPELHWAHHPEWAYGGGYYHVRADYRLMIDNLMDLTHETYVHATSIGQKEIDETPCITQVDGDHVMTHRLMHDLPEAPPFWKMALRGHGLPDDQRVDRWQICHFTPPTHVMIEVGVALAGHGGYEAPADKKVSSIVVDFITPETETSHHYFWGMARNFKPQDTSLTAAIREGQGKVFGEDMEMLERQQANLSAWPERKLLMLNIDAGGVQSRRVIDRLLAREAMAHSGGAMAPAPGTPLAVRIARKATEAQDICSLDLVSADGGALPGFSAGSHIDVHLPGGIVRQYSLCNDPAETHRYLIAVLREPASRGGSVAVHDAVGEGDTLSISAPRNAFALAGHAQKHLLLAGGIGITPILCMAERLAVLQADFELHYAARSAARMAFAERIRHSAFAGRTRFYLDDGEARQRLDLAALLARPAAGTHLYVCGPKGFMDAVLGTARAQGWDEAQLHWEFFANADAGLRSSDQAFEVQLASSGRVIQIPGDRTVTQALADAGVDVMVSCEQGVCGTCLTRVLQGEPEHRDSYLTPREQAANDQFTPCCSRSKTARLVLDL